MAATLISIAITPKSSSIAIGRTEQFNAIGYYSDGTTQDLTATANWVSSVPSVATITSVGLAAGVVLGTTTITVTSGAFSAATPLTITTAQHTHITRPIIMNTPLGHLKFRQSFVYNTPQIVAGPDPHTGHMNHKTTGTVVIQPKPLDALQPILEIRADIPAPGFRWGQEGRLLKDLAYPIKPVVESPTSSDSTSGIWRRGKTFSGKIRF